MRFCRLIALIRTLILRPFFRNCHSSVYIDHLALLVGCKFISIGRDSDIQYQTTLTAWSGLEGQISFPEIIIGSDCHIGAFNHITCTNKIIIGDGFVSGKWVTITDNSHGGTDFETLNLPVSRRKIISKGPVVVGKNVWVGDKVTILPGVTIGDGTIIGANSVVTTDVPSFCVVAGNPAKIIKRIKE